VCTEWKLWSRDREAAPVAAVARVPPVDLRQEERFIDAVAVLHRDIHQRIEQRLAQEMRLQPEIAVGAASGKVTCTVPSLADGS